MTHPLRMSKLTLGLVAHLPPPPPSPRAPLPVSAARSSRSGQPVAGAEVTITHTESRDHRRPGYNARACAWVVRTRLTITKPGEGTRPKMASTWA